MLKPNDTLDLSIETLGSNRVPSPMTGFPFVGDGEHVLFHSQIHEIEAYLKAGKPPPRFEQAGPRELIYFDPSKLKCGVVTCGGLCPGLNDVIRAVVMSLHYHYGVRHIFGFRFGYEGLVPGYGHSPLELSPEAVENIHLWGGTILGTSRGPQDGAAMVDTLDRMNVRLLFAIGGDGTLRGAHAIHQEIKRRRLKIGIVGIPKTIDNDISYVERSFGFDTAVGESRTAINSAHTEALAAKNGIGLVKLMGRHSGFIAAEACLANNDVNFCLIPEVPFDLDRFLRALKERLEARGHAVIVVAEGAGQELISDPPGKDASGNLLLRDIGVFLKNRIKSRFQDWGIDVSLKFIDPSYMIRSVPANPRDSAFCLLLGHHAVHAGMAGRTDMLVGHWKQYFTFVPLPLATSRRNQIDPQGSLWNHVLASTGQPRELKQTAAT